MPAVPTDITPARLEMGKILLKRTIEALGGSVFLERQSLILTGTGKFTTPPQIGGLTVPLAAFTLRIAAGGRCRLETLPVVAVISGEGRGGFVELAGRTLPLTAEVTDRLEPTELLRRAVRQGYPVAAVEETGEMTAEGVPLLVYDIYDPEKRRVRVFIEAVSGLVRKTVMKTMRGELTVLLSQYREVGGCQTFGDVTVLEDGANVFVLTASTIVVDEPVSDRLFQPK